MNLLGNANHKTKNTFQSQRQDYSFNSDSGNTVNLIFYKYSKYESADGLNAIKKSFKDFFLKITDEEEIDSGIDDESYSDVENSLGTTDLYEKKGFSKSIWNKLMKANEPKYEMLNESEVVNNENNTH